MKRYMLEAPGNRLIPLWYSDLSGEMFTTAMPPFAASAANFPKQR